MKIEIADLILPPNSIRNMVYVSDDTSNGCVYIHNDSTKAVRVVITNIHEVWQSSEAEKKEAKERKLLATLKAKYEPTEATP